MPCQALLATPARPLYEPSHRPPKKAPEIALFLLRMLPSLIGKSSSTAHTFNAALPEPSLGKL